MSGSGRLIAGLTLSVPIVALLSACVGASEGPPSAYKEPTWMADARSQRAEYQHQLQACIDGTGHAATVHVDGSVEFAVPEAEAASTSCQETTPLPLVESHDLATDYDWQLQTRECLMSQGYEMSQPPDKEAWVESEGQLWSPYKDIADRMNNGDITLDQSEWDELNRTCPQAGVKYIQGF